MTNILNFPYRVNKFRVKNSEIGFSVLEVVLAASLFTIFATGIAIAVISGQDNNRLAAEQLIANTYATEGLEAVRSIKNQAFTNLTNSSGLGLGTTANNLWSFSGTSNIFDKYTRTIAISDVQRDGSGNIVSSGGTTDPETKKISCTVSWNESPSRSNSVVRSTYLSNWKATGGGNGAPQTDCTSYCVSLGNYSTSACRQNSVQCSHNNETYESGGNSSCVTNFPGDPSHDTCCCQ